jgi:hypothetical protein
MNVTSLFKQAVEERNIESVFLLLENKTIIDLMIKDNSIILKILKSSYLSKKYNFTPMKIAANYSHIDILKALINRKNKTEEIIAFKKTNDLNDKIFEILWQDEKIKQSVKKNNIQLYNDISKKEAKIKILAF